MTTIESKAPSLSATNAPRAWRLDELDGLSTVLARAKASLLTAIDETGRLRYCSVDRLANYIQTAGPINIATLFEPEWTEERLTVLRGFLRDTDAETTVIDVVFGKEMWFHLTRIEIDDEPGLLIFGEVPHRDTPPLDPDEYIRMKRVVSPGRLLPLSHSEIELLWLLAKGHGRDEIPEILHRTAKAIERRRTTLGRKLAETKATELVALGRDAGLHRMTADELEVFAQYNCGRDAKRGLIQRISPATVPGQGKARSMHR